MFDSVSHMIFICLIVVVLRVVEISVLAYTCVESILCGGNENNSVVERMFWFFVVFQAELQRKLVEFDMSMCVSVCERE